jgi:hypothetical protein
MLVIPAPGLSLPLATFSDVANEDADLSWNLPFGFPAKHIIERFDLAR